MKLGLETAVKIWTENLLEVKEISELRYLKLGLETAVKSKKYGLKIF